MCAGATGSGRWCPHAEQGSCLQGPALALQDMSRLLQGSTRKRIGSAQEQVLTPLLSLLPVLVQDFYDVLGVDRGADKKAIKTAYRQKARQYHPDVNKEDGAEEKFKRISNAYEVLSDDSKRGIHDRCARGWDPVLMASMAWPPLWPPGVCCCAF